MLSLSVSYQEKDRLETSRVTWFDNPLQIVEPVIDKMGFVDRIKEFLSNSKRIIRIARRPEFQEVRLIARVSGVGILLVGAVAFLIQLLGNLVVTFFKGDASGGIIVLSMRVFITMLPSILVALQSPSMLLIMSGAGLIALGRARKGQE